MAARGARSRPVDTANRRADDPPKRCDTELRTMFRVDCLPSLPRNCGHSSRDRGQRVIVIPDFQSGLFLQQFNFACGAKRAMSGMASPNSLIRAPVGRYPTGAHGNGAGIVGSSLTQACCKPGVRELLDWAPLNKCACQAVLVLG